MNAEQESKLIYLLQRGLPLEHRPHAVLADAVGGIDENDVTRFINDCFENQKARCLRGVFNLQALGYTSALCAATTTNGELDLTASKIVPDDGVTHCYQRTLANARHASLDMIEAGSFPNLWFTYTALATDFQKKMETMRRSLHPRPFYLLPAVKRFKVEVVFDTRFGNDKLDEKTFPSPQRLESVKTRDFSAKEKDLIKALGNVPITKDPFADIAKQRAFDYDWLLKTLRTWRSDGVLRRVGLIMYHRRVGFRANGMAVWKAAPEISAAIGGELAKRKEVTHCYERQTLDNFPFNIYAMLHATDWKTLDNLFLALSAKVGVANGMLLRSTREYKKTSFKPF